MTPSTTSRHCSPDEVQCHDGTCLAPTKRCNFKNDCPYDTADEDGCPQFYSFEDCATTEACGWSNRNGSTELEWVVATADQVAGWTQTGPNGDYRNDSSGHFVFLKPINNEVSGITCSSLCQVTSSVAELSSPTYQDSASMCYFNFYLFLSGVNPVIRPYLYHKELEFLTVLDTIGMNVSQNGLWTKVEIGIGRHRDNFEIGFSLIHTGGPYVDSVAVDEVNFFDCMTPLPVEGNCSASHEPNFHCTISKACITSSLLCDYQDDCGDNSDEVFEGCSSYLRSNFEDPHHPFGFFTQEAGGLQWDWGNGTTTNEGTGPPFDHTLFSPYGHYLYIGSKKGEAGEQAKLWSPPLTKSQPRDCRLRLFAHMHGQGVGNLTVFARDADGYLQQLHQEHGAQPDMDINAWRRLKVELEGIESEVQIIIEATVGIPGHGDIAIDDVSFTPECMFSGGDPTEPTTHITTPHHTTEHHTTAQHTTAQHTTYQPTYPTGATPTATPSPGGGSHTVTVILVVLAILAILAGLAVAGFVAYKRKLQIPGMDRIQGFINPNYRRMAEDSNIVSLRDLSSRQS